LLLAFVLYEIHRKRRSPAEWFADLKDQSLPVRWLLRGLRPSRAVLYRFLDHLPPDLVDSLNQQILLLAVAESHTTAHNGAVDGTFTAACCSRHRLLNDKTLSLRLQQLDQAIARDDARVGTTPDAACSVGHSAAETAGQGTSDHALPTRVALPVAATASQQATAAPVPGAAPALPYWMAASAAGRLCQRSRYRLAQKTLKTRLIAHEAKQKGKSVAKRKSAAKVVISPMEPEAVLGKDKCKVFRPLYNTQIVQDLESPFVLGYGVYAQVTDSGLLPTMVQRTEALTGQQLKKLLSDGIYASLSAVRYCKKNDVDLYAPVAGNSVKRQEDAGQGKASTVSKKRSGQKKDKKLGKEQFHWEEALQTYRCPQGHLLQLGIIRSREREQGEVVQSAEYRCAKEHCMKCPQAQQCTSRPEQGRTVERMQGQELLDEVAAKMQTEKGKQEYKKRKQTVEPRHADMRQHRGLQRFHAYGLSRGRSEVGLLVLVHNGLTLLNCRKKAKAKQAPPPERPAAKQAPPPESPAAKQAPPPERPAAKQMTPERSKKNDNQEWLCYN
jgi:hypothetical protein